MSQKKEEQKPDQKTSYNSKSSTRALKLFHVSLILGESISISILF